MAGGAREFARQQKLPPLRPRRRSGTGGEGRQSGHPPAQAGGRRLPRGRQDLPRPAPADLVPVDRRRPAASGATRRKPDPPHRPRAVDADSATGRRALPTSPLRPLDAREPGSAPQPARDPRHPPRHPPRSSTPPTAGADPLPRAPAGFSGFWNESGLLESEIENGTRQAGNSGIERRIPRGRPRSGQRLRISLVTKGYRFPC